MTVTLTLPPQLEAMIQRKVESGHFNDPSEVVQEALRLMDQQDRLQRLRAAIAAGREQIERGEGLEFTAELHAEICRRAREKALSGEPIDADVVP